jgi:hypothetical protein
VLLQNPREQVLWVNPYVPNPKPAVNRLMLTPL